MSEQEPITHVATTDISDMLSSSSCGRRMPMKGFDDEFVDIADYIVRITDRIWHERRTELCRKYYAEDCVIHTLTGDIVGAATVEANTIATMKAFPGRTLDADNVIWSGNEIDGYYSSHLITSRMTNEGPSEFGAPTHQRARVRTIADCLCRENLVVEEWLVRDNGALVQQLGFDLVETAREQAKNDLAEDENLVRKFQALRDETLERPSRVSGETSKVDPGIDPDAFAHTVIGTMWNAKDHDALPDLFDFRVGAHMTSGRDLYGVVEYREYLSGFLASIPDARVCVDHVACIPYLAGALDIAVRWSLAGTHQGNGLFGAASGAPIYIMGASHWRVMNGRIREEWTVFDELAVHRQIETFRLM